MTDNLEIQNMFVDPTDAEQNSEFCKSGNTYRKSRKNLGLSTSYTAFTTRTTKPKAADKFAKCYIREEDGGWSGAIKGKPTDADCNVLSNCVGYAQGRFCEIYNEINKTTGNKYYYLSCNAKNFIKRVASEYPDLEVGDEPRPGAILVMDHPTKAGHVIIVERVNADGSIYTSESSYNGSAFYNKTRKFNDGHWGMNSDYTQLGFIYNPAVKEVEPAPETKFKIGDHVLVNGPLYRSSDATTPSWTADNVDTHITRYYKGAAHPYNTTGDLGWCDASIMTLITEETLQKESEPIKYDLYIKDMPHGVITVDKGKAAEGEVITIKAFPNKYYRLASATCNNIEIKDDKFIMPGKIAVIDAKFELIKHPIICKKSDNGIIYCDVDLVAHGEKVSIKVVPIVGYELESITSEQVEIAEDHTFIMPAKKVELTATFKEIDKPNTIWNKIIEFFKKIFKK